MAIDYKSNQRLDEKEIVLELVKKVSDKFLIEFKGGGHKKIIHHGNWSEEIIEPDSRKEAIQGVELITSFLRPHFNNKNCIELNMEEKYNKLICARKKLLEEYNKKNVSEDEDYISDKLVLMRDWFGELLMLLNKSRYLKGAKGV